MLEIIFYQNFNKEVLKLLFFVRVAMPPPFPRLGGGNDGESKTMQAAKTCWRSLAITDRDVGNAQAQITIENLQYVAWQTLRLVVWCATVICSTSALLTAQAIPTSRIDACKGTTQH